MEKITCKQAIPNEAIEKTPNIVGYAVDMMVRKLTEELGNILCDRREYVVKMESPTIEDAIAFNSTEYKACIKYEPLVRCKDCRYKDMELCAMYKLVVADVRKDDDFCSLGERKETDHA